MGRREEKKPRQQGTTSRAKEPQSAVSGRADKTPSAVLPQGTTSRLRPSWRFSLADQSGPWPFVACQGEDLHALLERLRSFESMTCAELEGGGTLNHYAVEALPTKEAVARLVDLSFDDQTRISRLRLGGKPRLYGFLDDDSTFHVLWWDPEHKVWPSTLRNT